MCRHLASKHPHVATTMSPYNAARHVTRTDQGATRRPHESRACPAARQEELTRLLATFVTDNMLPVSIVDSPSLRSILTYCEPNYAPPSGEMMKSRLRQLEREGREAVREDLLSATVVSITVDTWTSSVEDHYITVTASYVSEDWRLETPVLDTVYMTTDAVAECLHGVTEEWGITSKIAVCVLDGSVNCANVASSIGWTEVTCAAHTLQMCVEDGLGTTAPGKASENLIARTVNAASWLVGHFINNPLATHGLDIFTETQSRRLIQYTKSRWTSLVDMLETLTELRWLIVGILKDTSVSKPSNASTLDLHDDQWKLIADILPVLQPLKAATDLLCAESESTSACTVVYPTLFGLLKFHLTTESTDCATIRSFKETVSLQIIRRFSLDQDDGFIVKSPIATATVFDPVQKGLLLFDDSVRNCLYARIRQEIASLVPPPAAEATTETDEIEMKHNPVPLKLSRREQLRLLTGGNCGRPSGTNGTAPHHITELDRYLAANDDDDDEDVLQYWKAKEHTYPLMSKLARKYLGVPATSSRLSERGLDTSDLHSSISPDMANCLIFLNKNRK